MQFVLMLTLGVVMSSEYLVRLLDLPAVLRFLPECFSAIIIVYVAIAGTRDRFRSVAPKYWLLFGSLIVIFVCGIINNPPGSGPVLSAMRFYLRAIPLFFLPAVMPIDDRQLGRQFKLLLALGLVQLPVAIYQRWIVLDSGRYTGDEVRGTVMDSGILSIIEIAIACVLTGLLLRGRISKGWYAILFLLVLLPTTINETKATVLFLPIALFFTLIFGALPGKRLKYAGMGALALVAFGLIFVPVYNMMEAHNPYKSDRDIMNWFTDERQLEHYLSSEHSGLGTKKDVRRGDALTVTVKFLSADPSRLAFGLGVGSIAPSSFGKNFEGAYFQLFKNFLITSLTFFLIESGILGVIAIGVLHWLVFCDTLFVSRRDESVVGALAAGWVGVVALMSLGVTYTIVHEFTSVSYLFWYFSGVICARRVLIERKSPVLERSTTP